MPANSNNANNPSTEASRASTLKKSKKSHAGAVNRPPSSHSPISPTPISMYGSNPHHQQQQNPTVPLPPITAPYYNPVHGPLVSQQPVTSTSYGNLTVSQQPPYYSPYAPATYLPAGPLAQAPPPPSASSASTPPHQQTGYSHSNVPTPPATYPMPPQPPLNYNGQQKYYSPSTSYYSGPFGPPAPPSGAQASSGYPLQSKADYGTQPPMQRLTNGPLPGDGSQDSADSSCSADTRAAYDHQSIPGTSTSGSMPAPRTLQRHKVYTDSKILLF